MNSFDIVSKVDVQEVKNAVDQTLREIRQRFDFKGSKSEVRFENEEIILIGDDEYRLKSITDILQSKLVKRGVSLKSLNEGKVEEALGGLKKQGIKLQQGIPQEVAKEISRTIRDSRLKVQAQIQGDQLRVSGKKKDDLQATMTLLREKDLGPPLQFVNYR